MKKVGRGLFACAIVSVCVIGINSTARTAVAAKPPGGGLQCPDVWNPVICSNGQIYSNMCYATRAGATGCVYY